MLGPMRFVLVIVIIVAIASATLNVFGPTVLGHGTDIIVDGRRARTTWTSRALHHVLFQAVALYAASSLLSIVASYMLAGVIQRLDVPAALRRRGQGQRAAAQLHRQAVRAATC